MTDQQKQNAAFQAATLELDEARKQLDKTRELNPNPPASIEEYAARLSAKSPVKRAQEHKEYAEWQDKYNELDNLLNKIEQDTHFIPQKFKLALTQLLIASTNMSRLLHDM